MKAANEYFLKELENVQESMAHVLQQVNVKENVYVNAAQEHEQGEESLFNALRITMQSPF
jgi:hypothetical protein